MKEKTRQAQGTVKPHQIPPPEDMPTPAQLSAFRKKVRKNVKQFVQNLRNLPRD